MRYAERVGPGDAGRARSRQGTYIEFRDADVPDAWLDSLPKGGHARGQVARHARKEWDSRRLF
jgi:hypothetical protein